MKTQKRKNIATSMVITTGSILLVLNFVAAIIIGVIADYSISNKQDLYMQQTANSAQKQIEQFVQQYESVASVLTANHQLQSTMSSVTAETPLGQVATFPEVVSTLQEIMVKYPNILGMSVSSVTEDYIYDQNGQKTDIRLSQRPYYEVVSTKSAMVLDPYIDALTGQMCISVAEPVTYNNAVVGVLVVDLKLDQFSEYLSEMAFGETGRLILFDASETIMAAEDTNLVGQSMDNLGIVGDKFMQEFNNPTGKTEVYELNGEDRSAVVAQLPDYGWKVVVAMSRGEYSSDTISTIVALAILLIIVTVVVGVSIRFVIVKKLSPLKELNAGLKQMSEGNLSISIAHSGDDEIGEMADSLRSSIDTLSTYVGEISASMGELAKGNLDVKSSVQFKGDFAPIQISIESFVAKLTNLMKNIRQASDQVSNGADQVSSGAQALSQGATEQASSVQELAATIADISQAVNKNNEMVSNASQGATKVNSDIAESGNKMRQSLEVMGEIKASSNEISKIIKTIEDIAFQTNILALNAAVEAARAGSAGKGFAVVADEVRNLAGKSAEASQTTTALIETSLAAVEKGTVTMEQTAKFMENVVTEAQKITDVFDAIASASEEQANSISQVTLGIDQISGVVQTNSATAEQSAAASEELSSQAQLLNNLLAQFKIPQGTEEYKAEIPSEMTKDDFVAEYPTDDTYVSVGADKY